MVEALTADLTVRRMSDAQAQHRIRELPTVQQEAGRPWEEVHVCLLWLFPSTILQLPH